MAGESNQIKKGLKRKVKQPPVWPGCIPATRREKLVNESTPYFCGKVISPRFDQAE
jgi:hypothetical protein